MKEEFIDTHAHLFDERINISEVDVSKLYAVLVPSYSMQNLKQSLDFCKQYDKCYCALGIHPQYIDDFDLNILDGLIKENIQDIYAIGEIGLDSGAKTDYQKQICVFTKQVGLAKKYNLPISVHLRTKIDFDNFFLIMQNYKDVQVILHCFNGDEDDLQKALDSGYYISIATNVTYKGNVKLRQLCKKIPLDKLLIETDSPNLLPSIFARRGVNTSQNIIYVVEQLANIKNEKNENISKTTTKNAKKVLKIK